MQFYISVKQLNYNHHDYGALQSTWRLPTINKKIQRSLIEQKKIFLLQWIKKISHFKNVVLM